MKKDPIMRSWRFYVSCIIMLITFLQSGPASGQDLDNSHALSRGGDPPINDDCTGAIAQSIDVGGSLTFTGDNTGATELEGTPFIVVWEAFTLTDCATITIEHCMPDMVFETFMNTITNECPDTGSGTVAASVIEQCSMTFEELAAGTWYIPVLVDEELTPIGAYSFSISANECDPPYCMAEGLSQQTTGTIAGVTLSDMNYFISSTGSGYVDQTMETAYVGTGSEYELTITLNDSGMVGNIAETAQLLVWIDFDQNGDLADPGELVFISDDPLIGLIHIGNITIPPTAALGETRMRIRLHDTHDGSAYPNTPNTTPCDTSSFGQVHDLTVDIDLGTSITSLIEQSVSIHPNPADELLFVTLPGNNGLVRWEIMDPLGRRVQAYPQQIMNGEVLALGLPSSLSAGTYILRGISVSGSFNATFIKR